MASLRICKKGHRYFKTSTCPTCPAWETEKQPKTGFLSIISAPARRALESQGIKTQKQLAKLFETELLGLHGMGSGNLPPHRIKKSKIQFPKIKSAL